MGRDASLKDGLVVYLENVLKGPQVVERIREMPGVGSVEYTDIGETATDVEGRATSDENPVLLVRVTDFGSEGEIKREIDALDGVDRVAS